MASTTEPSPALRVALRLGGVVVRAVMAYLLGRETRAVKSPEKEAEEQG